MKITIKFSNEEKSTLTRMALSTGNVKEVVDKDEYYVGNFGEFKYDHNENEIIFDLKTAFIKASYRLVMSVVNMIKSMIETCEMFNDSWFSDTKDLLAEEAKKEKESEIAGYKHESNSFASEVAKELNK